MQFTPDQLRLHSCRAIANPASGYRDFKTIALKHAEVNGARGSIGDKILYVALDRCAFSF